MTPIPNRVRSKLELLSAKAEGTETWELGSLPKFFTINNQKVALEPNQLLVVKSKNGKPRTLPLSAEARRIAEHQVSDFTNTKYLFTSIKGG
jgi:hypothetical protein